MRYIFEEWIVLANGIRSFRGSNPNLSDLFMRHPTMDKEWLHRIVDMHIGETIQFGAHNFKRIA